jgi:hypothetical protein
MLTSGILSAVRGNRHILCNYFINTNQRKGALMNEFATNLLKDVKVYFLASNCTEGGLSEIEAEQVEYCIASGFVRIQQKETKRIWITHISNVSLQFDAPS